jgi:hypothetical protein
MLEIQHEEDEISRSNEPSPEYYSDNDPFITSPSWLKAEYSDNPFITSPLWLRDEYSLVEARG